MVISSSSSWSGSMQAHGESKGHSRSSSIEPIALLPYKSDFILPKNQIIVRRVMSTVIIIGIGMLLFSFLAIIGFCLQSRGGPEALSFIQSIGWGLSNLIKDTGLVLPIVFTSGGVILILLGLFHMPKKLLIVV
ncbi:hypothetical protein CLAVI_000619 [Candidatus Clavichlamydia salmonicola]|uniref:hypothetical protein n=1 Tax=Candidatus Clavichlamydia salmonicola TaxID=469812 RepID=UPI001891EF96|nr:hypothetical protein [Candidatus Clavichlamydia salmonicola]MBF5050995.1 hypothetical protein [Candidatus Clavichlamydia salmonicola]